MAKKKQTKAERWNFSKNVSNIILIRTDDDCDMAEVLVNGKCVYSGNYWDYHNNCHGHKDFKFNCLDGFVAGLKVLALEEFMKVATHEEEYSYEDE